MDEREQKRQRRDALLTINDCFSTLGDLGSYDRAKEIGFVTKHISAPVSDCPRSEERVLNVSHQLLQVLYLPFEVTLVRREDELLLQARVDGLAVESDLHGRPQCYLLSSMPPRMNSLGLVSRNSGLSTRARTATHGSLPFGSGPLSSACCRRPDRRERL